MSDNTGIEWSDATWNPVTGCTKVSPGCDHCYAETLHNRFHGKGSFDTVRLNPDKLDLPSRWRKPRRVFVNSMSDLFHAAVPSGYIEQVFAEMIAAPRHTFQVLTKRHGRMRSFLRSYWRDIGREPAPNIWLGVSVENQQWADIRIPALLDTPAAVRFLSCEPLLGPVNLHHGHSRCPTHDFAGGFCTGPCPDRYTVDWLIVGGESGHGARPMHPDWARSLRDQCTAAGVAFHFKQAGSVLAREWGGIGKGGDPDCWPEPFPREYPHV